VRKEFGKNLRIHFPTDKKLFGDNAGMIAVAAYHHARKEKFDDVNDIERLPNWSL
jgi:tRNA A37 threonylcarbamoyltransferase TsaD